MREQKYADVLKKYEEEMKTVGEAEDETFIKETSESLSMTRELKFKDLQKQIDDEYFEEIEVEETTDNGNTEEVKIKEEVIEDKSKEDKINEAEIKEEKAEVKEDKNKVRQDNKNIDDDLYLTTSFKPLKKRFKLRKVFKVIFIILFVVLLFGCLGYFVVRPLYNKYLQSKPQAILETVIDKTSEKIVSVLDANIVDDTKYYFDVNFRLNSNIDDLYYLTNSNYGFRMGVDPDNKLYDEMVYIKDGQDIYGLNYFEKNNKAYMKFSNSTNILDLGDVEEDDEYYTVKEGTSEGILIGGNLSLVSEMSSGKYSIDFKDKILFIEELGFETGPALAYNYLYYMKQNGVFDKINGLWIGSYNHESNISLEKIVFDVIGDEYDFPIIKSDNFGHIEEKIVIPIGTNAKIDTNTKEKIMLLENCVK